MMYMSVNRVQIYLAAVVGMRPVPEFVIDEERSKRWGKDVISCDQIKKVMSEQDFREMQTKINTYVDTSEDITIC